MLTAEQLEHFRQKILVELRSTVQEISANTSETPVELDQTSVGRLSRMDAMQQQAMSAGLRERLLLKRRRLEAALVRAEDGTFGRCCQCGAAIALERLQADPGAPFCPDCQEDISEGRRTG